MVRSTRESGWEHWWRLWRTVSWIRWTLSCTCIEHFSDWHSMGLSRNMTHCRSPSSGWWRRKWWRWRCLPLAIPWSEPSCLGTTHCRIVPELCCPWKYGWWCRLVRILQEKNEIIFETGFINLLFLKQRRWVSISHKILVSASLSQTFLVDNPTVSIRIRPDLWCNGIFYNKHIMLSTHPSHRPFLFRYYTSDNASNIV